MPVDSRPTGIFLFEDTRINTLFLHRRSLPLGRRLPPAQPWPGCATRSPSLAEALHIVFVHGNGNGNADTAAGPRVVLRVQRLGVPQAQARPAPRSNPASGTRAITAEFNGEWVVGRTWPAAQVQVVMLETSP